MKKIAIVTGASRGIGRAVAKRLVQDGFGVVVNYLSNASEAEQVVSEIQRIGGNAIAVKADVVNQADVERLFDGSNLPTRRLRDHDQPVGVCVAFPGILDLGERNTLRLDAQSAAGYTVHHLLERVGEYVPRRHASGS